MAGYVINAKSEALDLRELSSEELDAVSGGRTDKEQENRKQLETLDTFRKALQSL